jgi:spermidine synthase
VRKKFLFGKNWFFEDIRPGERLNSVWGVIPEKEVYSGKGQFQKIEIFDTEEFGRILALDGFIQLSTKYEFVYHEMLTQPAMFYHPGPGKVLIIGGGDGGSLREIAKHYSVKEIFLVDVDKKIIEVSKKYLPSVSGGAFNDKRLKIFNEDASKFVGNCQNYFDVIIYDLTDPGGPSLALWKTGFYKDILKALKKNGIAAFQTAFFQEKFAQKARKIIKELFPYYKLHRAFVGCFPFDEHTFSFGSKQINFDRVGFQKIKEKFKKLKIKTKYYSPEIHFASAVLPQHS